MTFLRYLFCTSVVALLLAEPLAAERQYNIFLVDQNQLGMGDMISNWTVAQHLKAKHPKDKVVFYVSSAFHQKFSIIEPEFVIPASSLDKKVHEQMLYGIRLLTTKAGVDPSLELSMELLEMFDAGAPSDDKICNLAFTANRPDVFRKENSQLYHIGEVPQSMAMLQSTRGRNVPFIVTKYMFDANLSRTDMTETIGALELTQSGFPTAFFLNSNMYNKNLYVSKKALPGDTGDLGVGSARYRSYVHADSIDAIEDYLTLVEAMANEVPNENFSVVLTKKYETFRHDTRSENPAPMMNLNGGNSDFPEKTNFVEVVRGLHDNLFIRQYDGIPFRDTLRLIRGSTLPIFVTGTMSLSSAMQYDKPFLYELMNHHGTVSGLMAYGVTQDPENYLTMLIPNRRKVNGAVRVAKVHRINTDTLVTISPAVDLDDISPSHRLVEHFGFKLKDGVLAFDQAHFDKQYLKQTARLKDYRTHKGPWKKSNLPKAHLIDDIPRMCKQAHKTSVHIRKTCAGIINSKEQKNCVVREMTKSYF